MCVCNWEETDTAPPPANHSWKVLFLWFLILLLLTFILVQRRQMFAARHANPSANREHQRWEKSVCSWKWWKLLTNARRWGVDPTVSFSHTFPTRLLLCIFAHTHTHTQTHIYSELWKVKKFCNISPYLALGRLAAAMGVHMRVRKTHKSPVKRKNFSPSLDGLICPGRGLLYCDYSPSWSVPLSALPGRARLEFFFCGFLVQVSPTTSLDKLEVWLT